MRSALVLVPEVGLGSGPDLTRYLVVCAGSILGLLALAWVFRRTVARHLSRRAAQRSLQVLDVLPLAGKQKLVVVRCYERSFLLGVGEKEVRSIAELELELAPLAGQAPRDERAGPVAPFGPVLRRAQGVPSEPPAVLPRAEQGTSAGERTSLRAGVVA